MSRIYICLFIGTSFLISCSRQNAGSAPSPAPECSEQIQSTFQSLKSEAAKSKNLVNLKKSCAEFADLILGETCAVQDMSDTSQDLCREVDAKLNAKTYPAVIPLDPGDSASQTQISTPEDSPPPTKPKSPIYESTNPKLDYFLLGADLIFNDDKILGELSIDGKQGYFQSGKILRFQDIDSRFSFCYFVKKSFQLTKDVHFSFIMSEKNHLSLYTRDFEFALRCSRPENGDWYTQDLQDILGVGIELKPTRP